MSINIGEQSQEQAAENLFSGSYAGKKIETVPRGLKKEDKKKVEKKQPVGIITGIGMVGQDNNMIGKGLNTKEMFVSSSKK